MALLERVSTLIRANLNDLIDKAENPEILIKQVILDLGPVSCAVYADAAMTAYRGGVFNSCGFGAVNHAVMIVGWDDTQGANGVWIMRNSWGTAWGENGYMRIQYGCSSIGYAANFID